jgi:transposase-like protein
MSTQAPPVRSTGEARLGPDRLTEALRERIREVIVTLVEGELTETLAAVPSQRMEGRRGSRHGREPRTITTGLGAATVELPRGRPCRRAPSRGWWIG